jgi:DNA-binding MarR family transcriptional regulator
VEGVDAARFSPTIALLTLARSAEVDVARILEPHGLSVRKLAILQRLSAVPGATPADLARAIGITAEEVQPMLRAMIAVALVKRGRDGILSVGEAGSLALERVDAALTELDDRLFEGRAALSGELFDAVQRPVGEPQD